MVEDKDKNEVIITSIVTLNGGDAAILFSEIEMIGNALGNTVKFSVHDKNPEASKRLYPEIVFHPWISDVINKMRPLYPKNPFMGFYQRVSCSIHNRLSPIRFRLAVLAYKSRYSRALARLLTSSGELAGICRYFDASLIVSTGGTYIIPEYGISSRRLEYFLIRHSGNPHVLFTQSIGQLETASEIRTLSKLLEYSSSVLVRDHISKQNVASIIGESCKIQIRADAVFRFASPELFYSNELIDRGLERFRVGISVREWGHFPNCDSETKMRIYVDTIRSLVEHCVDKYGAEIVFLSTCQGVDEYTDDSKLATIIYEGLREDVKSCVTVETQFINFSELIGLLRSFDLTVCTRMHMFILSLCSGVPGLPIAYGFKTKELASRVGLEDFCVDIGCMQEQELIEKFELLKSRRTDLSANLAKSVEELKTSSMVDLESLRIGKF